MKLFLVTNYILISVYVHAQLIVPSDSSSIVYPDQAKIFFSKKMINHKTYFMMERKDFKGLIFITNFMLQRLDLSSKNEKLLSQNSVLLDSVVTSFEAKLNAEQNRVELYKNSYEDLKNVSAAYDQELWNCRNDLERLKNQRQLSRKANFIKGGLWGLAIGALGGLALGLSN